MTISIDQVMHRIPAWSGRSPVLVPLAGGLTNRIYRVDVDGVAYVVRIPGDRTEWLAIDRTHELHNTRAAAVAGVAPRVVHQLPDVNVLVLEFIHGETLTIPAMQRPGMPTQIARVLKQLHAGPRFLGEFDIFRITRHYLEIAQRQCIRIPDDYLRYMPQVERIEAAFTRWPVPTVPCHNDLLAANVLDDGQRLWLIDFEYSGNNDATFELGNTCRELQFDEPRVAEMCAAYFGDALPVKFSRMNLNMIMSDVGWSLWAAIQAAVSTIEFDFWGWAVERWDRASAGMNSSDFTRWLRVLETSESSAGER
jgi:thiamine kinase-like enzyme